ncbi:hypothetical protein YUWDRAFT_03828 [Streptomyces sp. AmelKG-D3]|nr:hypothetical protein YUWDRAFT_03828 [Streptomyces sp. AmelKG-D3]
MPPRGALRDRPSGGPAPDHRARWKTTAPAALERSTAAEAVMSAQQTADSNQQAQPGSPSSRAISIRWTSDVPSPISRIFESRHIRATGYSFMKP